MYSNIKKLSLTLFVSTKNLRPYFQSHKKMVVTFYALHAILHNSNVVKQLMKWSVALSEFHIVYESRKTLKA